MAKNKELEKQMADRGFAPAQGVAAGGVQIKFYVGKVKGKGCERRVALGATFENTLVPAIGCVGAPQVLTLLNFYLELLCLKGICPTELKCPARCPCKYIKATALDFYNCGAKVETGAVLPPIDTPNCLCVQE